ncbi:MAG: leucine-rich repeat domain-containing protein [Clostridia bacterium]|nr:leucine-rich repeat domain-containing protein [Clostridia bacterium]
MGKQCRRILALILVFILTMSIVSPAASAEAYSGTCGANVAWSLDTSTGVLSVTGTDSMTTFSAGGAPWYAYREDIQAVMIGSGVTNISDYAFQDCANLAAVSIPDSVFFIGNSAFCGCSALTGVTIPGGVECINSKAFFGCTSLTGIRPFRPSCRSMRTAFIRRICCRWSRFVPCWNRPDKRDWCDRI